MSRLPETVSMRETHHGHGAKGMAFYRYADGTTGVRLQARRETSRHLFVESFTWDYLPGQTFPSYGLLREAAEAVTDADIAAEKAMYPYIRSSEPANMELGNRCRLCREPASVRVQVARNWQPVDDAFASLCEEHAPLKQTPEDLLQALSDEVAARKARAAAKGLL